MLLTEFGAVRASSTERDSIQTINCNNFNILIFDLISIVTINGKRSAFADGIVVFFQQSRNTMGPIV